MKPRVLPFWVHVVIVGGIGLLFLGFLIVRGGGFEARASSMFDQIAGTASPILNAQAMLGRRNTQFAKGAYTLNGMHVKYFTVAAPQGGGRAIIELEEQMARAGYLHRILPIQGAPTLFGVHPDTKMMLSARPGRDLNGRAVVRLSQQDLSELREDFKAEIPGIPVYPGSSGETLISSSEDSEGRKPSDSLMYAAGGTADDVRGYYLKEMKLAGWSVIAAPSPPRGLPMDVLFFEKDGRECSVLVSEIPQSASSLVLVTASGSQAEQG